MENSKFQWSMKLDNGEIYVIRANTFNELKLERELAMVFIEGLNTILTAEEPIDPEEDFEEEMDKVTDPSYCKIHDVNMKEREGKYGKFFSHGIGTYPNLKWCNGRE